MKNSALAILCGGHSRRLGTDKGLYNPLGDESLVQRQIRIFRQEYGEILIVVKDEEQRQFYVDALADCPDVSVIADQDYCPYGADAALTGIQTALKATSYDEVAVIPVDQLGVRPLHTRNLSPDARAYATAEEDFLAFPSLWQKRDLNRINALAQTGLRSIKGVLRALQTPTLDGESYKAELHINGNTSDEIHTYLGKPLTDTQGRRLHYLRFSLIEACNLSCSYCLPEGFPEWYRHKAKLSSEDLQTVLMGFRRMGFRKLRLTGGEPTLHKGCLDAVSRGRRLGYEEIALTTNGLLIDDIKAWRDAGLTSLNVSLDTVDAALFKTICKSGDVGKVVKLVEDAAALGMNVKINTVLQRSLNGQDGPLRELIKWALPLDVSLRFIELMDTKLNSSFATNERVLGSEVMPYLEDLGYESLKSQNGIQLGGPATEVASQQHQARFGFINPISCNFCDLCNRLRVTARGNLRLCLFGDNETPLNLESPEGVELSVRAALGDKPAQHYLLDGKVGDVATFRTIGG